MIFFSAQLIFWHFDQDNALILGLSQAVIKSIMHPCVAVPFDASILTVYRLVNSSSNKEGNKECCDSMYDTKHTLQKIKKIIDAVKFFMTFVSWFFAPDTWMVKATDREYVGLWSQEREGGMAQYNEQIGILHGFVVVRLGPVEGINIIFHTVLARTLCLFDVVTLILRSIKTKLGNKWSG
ncbi:hypothetical protein ACJX0J_032783 [Zea mays]